MSRGKKGLLALAVLVAVGSIVWVALFKKNYDLLNACEKCDAAEVERLLERGANPNAQRKGVLRRPVTALMLAVSCDRVPTKRTNEPIGDPRVVKLLLDHGADMNRACGEGTLLHWAVGRPPMDDEDPEERLWKFLGFRLRPAPGNPEVIKLLLAAGADINAGTVNAGTSRFTPLDRAILCDPKTNIDCIHVLIQHGATRSLSFNPLDFSGPVL